MGEEDAGRLSGGCLSAAAAADSRAPGGDGSLRIGQKRHLGHFYAKICAPEGLSPSMLWRYDGTWRASTQRVMLEIVLGAVGMWILAAAVVLREASDESEY